MKKIKLTEVKVDLLKSFFDEIDIKSSQTILFTKDSISAKAYPSSKTFIKYKSIDTEGLFVGKEQFEDKTLKLPLNSLSNIEKVLSFFNGGDITITIFVDGDYISKMEFDNGVHLFVAKSSDVEQVAPPLNNEIWGMFESTDGSYVNISMTSERIKQIIKLHDICGTKSNSVVITNHEKDGIIITNSHHSLQEETDKWTYKIPQVDINTNDMPVGESRIFNINTLDLIKDKELELFIKDSTNLEGKSILIFKANEKSIVIGVSSK
jgi:hypothetical protein